MREYKVFMLQGARKALVNLVSNGLVPAQCKLSSYPYSDSNRKASTRHQKPANLEKSSGPYVEP